MPAASGLSLGRNTAAPLNCLINRAAFAKCLPASLQRLRTRFTSPSQTLRQVLNPPQTNITTSAYTIGGVDQTNPTMGVVTETQVTDGHFLSAAGGNEALVSGSYATKQKLKLQQDRPLAVPTTGDHLGQLLVIPGLVLPRHIPGSFATCRIGVPPSTPMTRNSELGLS